VISEKKRKKAKKTMRPVKQFAPIHVSMVLCSCQGFWWDEIEEAPYSLDVDTGHINHSRLGSHIKYRTLDSTRSPCLSSSDKLERQGEPTSDPASRHRVERSLEERIDHTKERLQDKVSSWIEKPRHDE